MRITVAYVAVIERVDSGGATGFVCLDVQAISVALREAVTELQHRVEFPGGINVQQRQRQRRRRGRMERPAGEACWNRRIPASGGEEYRVACLSDGVAQDEYCRGFELLERCPRATCRCSDARSALRVWHGGRLSMRGAMTAA